jgi:hypothetical protein
LLAGLAPSLAGSLVHEFEFGGDDEEASALLAKLVGAGVPVAEFASVEPDLERLYLERVRGTA